MKAHGLNQAYVVKITEQILYNFNMFIWMVNILQV